MRTRALCLVLCLGGCASTPALQASPTGSYVPDDEWSGERLRTKVDDATGLRVFSVVPDLGESRAGKLSMASLIIDGQLRALEGRASGQLGFQTTSKEVRFKECRRMALEVDGRPLPAQEPLYFGSLGRGNIVEAVMVPVSPADLERMGRAERVRYRLCRTEGELSRGDRKLLRVMVARWREASRTLARR